MLHRKRSTISHQVSLCFSSSSNSSLFCTVDQVYNFQFLTQCSSIFASSTPPMLTNTDAHNNKTQLICKSVAPEGLRLLLFLLVFVCGLRAGSGFLVCPGLPILFLVVLCFFVVSCVSWFPFVFILNFLVCSWCSCFFWVSCVFPCFSSFFLVCPGCSWFSLLFLVYPVFSWCSWFCLKYFCFFLFFLVFVVSSCFFLVFLFCSGFVVFASFLMVFLVFPGFPGFPRFSGFPVFVPGFPGVF